MSDVAAYHVFVCALFSVQGGMWTGYGLSRGLFTGYGLSRGLFVHWLWFESGSVCSLAMV